MSCPATINAWTAYQCKVASTGASMRFELDGAPEGMAVHERSGLLRWTPTAAQVGNYYVTLTRRVDGTVYDSTSLHFNVKGGLEAAPRGIYVSTTGSDSAAGTYDQPLATIDKASKLANPGDTIYLRGGVYRNPGYGTSYAGRTRGNLSRVIASGTASAWITLRPNGNELVKLKTDVNGLVFQYASYWKIQNLEIEGNSQSLTADDALATWWQDPATVKKTTGVGIYLGDSFNFEISGCAIHDFPGPGVTNNHGAYLTITGSAIYNNAWWSTNGVHGVTDSKPKSIDNSNTSATKMSMLGNLVYGNQSSMISNVYAGGFEVLDIDEGNGLHMQNTDGAFVGKFLVQDNLALFNGKGGFGMNTITGGTVRNNSFYRNAQAVDTGELVLQRSTADSVDHNLFQAMPARRTINDLTKAFTNVGTNYAVPAADADKLPIGIKLVSSVFVNPGAMNFSASSAVPTGYGASPTALSRMANLISTYGLTPAPAPTVVDATYLRKLKGKIFSSWPAPVAGDGIPDDLKLQDPDTGYCYDYAHRGAFPGPSGVSCR